MPPADTAVDESTAPGFDTAHVAGRGARVEQQDAWSATQVGARGCWVVADGLGGHRGGAVAARLAVDAAFAAFRAQPEVSSGAVARGIAAAQAAVVAGQREDPSRAGMRATIVVLVADEREAVWGHVGDSRLYRVEGGLIRHRTRDHSISQARVNAGELAEADQGRDVDRDRLFRAIGQTDGVEPDILAAAEPLHAGDAFLLCTDGFWSTVSDPAIEIDLAATDSAAGWLARLDQRAAGRRGAGSDNYTALAVRVRVGAALPPARPRPAADSTAADAFTAGSRRRRQAAPPGATGTRASGPSWRRAGRTLWALLLAAGLVSGGVALWRMLADRRAAATPPATPPAAATPTPSPAGAPEALPQGVVLRVSSGERFASLPAAIAAASPGDEIWIGRGVYRVSALVVDKELHLRGAGREATTLDAGGGAGIELSAGAGSIADLEVCCAATGPLLDLAGAFAGIVSRLRLRDGAGAGVRVRGTATPTIEETTIEGVGGERVQVEGEARPVFRGAPGL